MVDSVGFDMSDDGFLEKLESMVSDLYDEIDSITSEYDYEFVESMVDKVARGTKVSENQWEKIQMLHQRFCS